MHKTVKIPTLLGLITLIGGLIGGIVMINSRQQLVTKAAVLPAPDGVALSNITDRSFTVSWTTSIPATGFIKLMPQAKLSEKIIPDDRDRDGGFQNKRTVHYVVVDSLTPGETYKFVIGGDNSQFDRNGSPFSVRIARALSLAPQSDIASGVILSEDGQSVSGIIVYIQLPGGQLASALSGSGGKWAIPLSAVRTENGDSWLNYDLSATIYAIKADGGAERTAEAILTTAIDKPVPPLKLGNSYDFRKSREPISGEAGKQAISSETSVSDKNRASSLFDFSSLGPVTPLNEGLTLDNPKKAGEIIYTDKPEFFGSGPAGSPVEVMIESVNPITGETQVDSSGKWSFPATASLKDGNHAITLKWTDANGIVQVLKRSFVVNAVSGRPAYVSTPSATPTSKSKSPTPTAPPKKSVPATSSGIPKSGGLTETVIMFMIGLTLVATGLFSTVKPNKNLIK